jgi:hypothetical protein
MCYFYVKVNLFYEKRFFKNYFLNFLCLFVIKKNWLTKKHFSIKRKYFLKIIKQIRNIILFANYIKFDIQTFDYCIFCFESFFLITSFRIWFNLIFISTLVLIFIIVTYFSLIIFLFEIFYPPYLDLILLIIIYFIWNNLWNYNYFFNFIIF